MMFITDGFRTSRSFKATVQFLKKALKECTTIILLRSSHPTGVGVLLPSGYRV